MYSKPFASTFALLKKPDEHGEFFEDYLPYGGTVEDHGGTLTANVTYRTFRGTTSICALSETKLRVDLSVDTSANQGPFAAAIVLKPQDLVLKGANGRDVKLGEEPVSLTLQELGGSFRIGRVQVKAPRSVIVHWPLLPFNSYAANNKADLSTAELRVYDELTPERSATMIELEILPA